MQPSFLFPIFWGDKSETKPPFRLPSHREGGKRASPAPPPHRDPPTSRDGPPMVRRGAQCAAAAALALLLLSTWALNVQVAYASLRLTADRCPSPLPSLQWSQRFGGGRAKVVIRQLFLVT